MLRPLIVTSLLLLSAFAGCLTPPEQVEEASLVLPPAEPEGELTIEDELDETTVEPCLLSGGINVLTPEPYCAKREVLVSGALTLTSLAVALDASAADIVVDTSNRGEWALAVLITGRGATEAAARDDAGSVEVLRDIGAPGAHALDVAVKPATESSRATVEIVLSLPAATLYELLADTGSGDVTLGGLRTTVTDVDTGSGDVSIGGEWLAALLKIDTGSGDVAGDVDAATANIETGSGDITLDVTPTAPGAIELSTGSGSIALKLVDDRSHAYDLTATTGSGEITFDLRGGRTQSSTENVATFTTTDAAATAVRTVGTFTTGSGDISVSGA